MFNGMLERSPLRAFEASTHGGLATAEIGVLLGPPGVGKTQLLVHLGLARALRGQAILHVSLTEPASDVHSRYSEILEGVCKVGGISGQDRETALVQAERQRQIVSLIDKHQVSELQGALDFCAQYMDHRATLLLVDGFAAGDAEKLKALRALAAERELGIWLSTVGPVETLEFDTVVELSPHAELVELLVHKVHGRNQDAPSGLHLDPASMLVSAEDSWDPASAPPSPTTTDCTLYSGGAPGAEACFGENAARYKLAEINFTFEGHKQSRTERAQMLSPRELAAGDVSLVYVSKRLKRSYSEGSMIRKVLQSLWHQVSRAQQVFVIGAIQADGTVTGGTGWSVELARMWHKNLWVFDQEKNSWFHWAGERWVEGVPVIENAHFCGTGTRSLTDGGRKAVGALFDRSFANNRRG
jgi:hypothetical protein